MASPGPSTSRSEDTCAKKRKLSDSPGLDDTSYRSCFHINSSTSKLIREDLESLGIFYAKAPIHVESLFAKLKGTSQRLKIPKFLAFFETLLQEKITFSLDMKYLDDPCNIYNITTYQFENVPVLDKEIKALHKLFIEAYEDRHKEMLQRAEVDEPSAELFLRLFNNWVSFLAPEFLQSCESLMTLFGSVRNCSQSDKYITQVPESTFTNLIKDFSKMMFLTPSLSDNYDKSEMLIKGRKISSVPDVVFLEGNNKGLPTDQVVMIIEVKRSALIVPHDDGTGETWIGNRLSKEILGQIGSELLVKRNVSAFRPYVLGILCMRTEIMFILLEMSHDHLWKIQHDKDLSGERTVIQYTETFDIMKAEDRAKVCGYFLWLGYLQKRNLRRFYCKD